MNIKISDISPSIQPLTSNEMKTVIGGFFAPKGDPTTVFGGDFGQTGDIGTGGNGTKYNDPSSGLQNRPDKDIAGAPGAAEIDKK